jgi:general nucleoside transport system permease protein
MAEPVQLPRWMELLVLPAVNIGLALLVAGLVVWGIGLDPWQVLGLLIKGAFGSPAGIGYTLHHTTTFIFTGLAVAVAYHAGLFNIGAEGQAMMGGLGAALAALWLGDQWPALVVLPAMVLAAMALGMLWGAVPGALQAWRGSHIVITTIMFNFMAAALLVYLLVGVMKEPGNMAPETRAFGPGARLPGMHELLAALGLNWPKTPWNLSFILALLAAAAVSVSLWRSKAGYAVRATGYAPEAARYAGLAPERQLVLAMAASGALAGLVGINEVAGAHQRLMPDFTAGAGFAGIAVSLIGRNHPGGIVAAALLFGALYQGGAELVFEVPGFSRDMVLTLQGLIVLFAGAMSMVAAPWLARLVGWWRRPARAAA